MGGTGSGARRSTFVGYVEDMLALDIRVLRRLGVVRPGECIIDTCRWSIGGLRASSARLRVDLSDVVRGGTITITGDMADGTIKQRIAIKAVASSLGGWRCYFICPVTAAPCEVLYYAGGGFASCKAQRLSYAVRGMTDLRRARYRAAKLRSRLEGLSAMPRPRGSNRVDIVQRATQAEREVRSLYIDRLRAHAGRSDSRWILGDER